MRSSGIEYKTRGELQMMRASGVILARAIAAGRAAAVVGATTGDVDEAVAAVIRDAGAVSNFKGYGGDAHGHGAFTGTICASVNDEIVHGIPGSRVLRDGDLLSIDAGCVLDGWHSDSAISLHIGEPSEATGAEEVDLILATERAMWAGIAAVKADGRLGDVSWAIGTSAEKSAQQDGRRYGNVAGYGGHGIGTAMHMEPFIPNLGKRGKGPKLAPGMALAIEPMLTLGKAHTSELDDGWTVVTRDGSRAAHFEHSVAVLSDGICVLTAADGGLAGLASAGIVPVDLD